MSARILVGREPLASWLGDAFYDELTFPKIFKDSVEAIAPVVVARGDTHAVAIGDFDAAAFQAAARQVPFETFGRYFTWNNARAGRPASFAEAVRRLAGDGRLDVDAAMPASRFLALAASGPATVHGKIPEGPFHLYRKRRTDIEAQWRASRDADAARLAAFVDTLRFGPALRGAMAGEPVGYAPLDRLCEAQGFAALLVSSSFNAEMFTGLPAAAQAGLAALFVPGADEILLLSPEPFERADFRPAGRAESLAAILAECGSGVVGCEFQHLATDRFQRLQAAGLRVADATETLRRWQDERAGTDLPYFIAAANGVLQGIAAAEAFLQRRLGTLPLETEVAAIYHHGVAAFARRIGLEARIHAYFDIIHAGERTLLPASVGAYPLRPSDRTIKFDMGLLVTDGFGCVRGCSDIARTLSADPAVRDIHDALRDTLVHALIPSIQPGQSGEAIHARGVDLLRPLEGAIRQAGLLPAGLTIDDYTRDCGHTLQRQTLGSVHFLPGCQTTVQAGMLGCTEYVWPIDDRIVAVEDAYYVTTTGAIPFTI